MSRIILNTFILFKMGELSPSFVDAMLSGIHFLTYPELEIQGWVGQFCTGAPKERSFTISLPAYLCKFVLEASNIPSTTCNELNSSLLS